MAVPPTRDEVFTRLARASLEGYLGLFVGTGLSIALTKGKAPNFKDLLKKVCDDIGVRFDFDDASAVLGKSFPQIASALVELKASANKHKTTATTDYQAARQVALNEVRKAIATRTNLEADKNLRAAYKKVLAQVAPAWIVTTNYDFILESLVDRSVSLLPQDFLLPRTDLVPIYHLHGHRRRLESIVVTEEDYVGLFGPLEYRQQKLNLLLAESSTVMLGYSLGDFNVRAALSWARGFSDASTLKPAKHNGFVVQALWSKDPCSAPYVGADGVTIVEIKDIESFLAEVADAITKFANPRKLGRKLVSKYLNQDSHQEVADKPALDIIVMVTMMSSKLLLASEIEQCINRMLEPIWVKAGEAGGIDHYNAALEIVLGILVEVTVAKCPPCVFATLASALGQVALVIGNGPSDVVGKSVAATDTWHKRKSDLRRDVKRELKDFAQHNQNYALEQLLK